MVPQHGMPAQPARPLTCRGSSARAGCAACATRALVCTCAPAAHAAAPPPTAPLPATPPAASSHIALRTPNPAPRRCTAARSMAGARAGSHFDLWVLRAPAAQGLRRYRWCDRMTYGDRPEGSLLTGCAGKSGRTSTDCRCANAGALAAPPPPSTSVRAGEGITAWYEEATATGMVVWCYVRRGHSAGCAAWRGQQRVSKGLAGGSWQGHTRNTARARAARGMGVARAARPCPPATLLRRLPRGALRSRPADASGARGGPPTAAPPPPPPEPPLAPLTRPSPARRAPCGAPCWCAPR